MPLSTSTAQNPQLSPAPSSDHPLPRSLFEHLSIGIIVTDPRQPDNPITYVNAAFHAVTGYAPAEAIGRNCRFLQGPNSDSAVIATIRQAVAEGRSFRGLLLNYRKDGSSFWNGLVVDAVRDEQGILTHFVATLSDVTASREQLRALAARLSAVREEERTELSREIHDQLGQAMTGLKMDLAWLQRRVRENAEIPNADLLLNKMREMSGRVDETIGSVRRIATQLRPAVLDDLGLEAAIEWQLNDFQARHGLKCGFTSNLGQTALETATATALFRILQESLTNILRHAKATAVDVTLELVDEGVQLKIKDNGRGVTAHDLSNVKSLGLLGMRERAALVGGKFHIYGEVGHGTTVTVQISLSAQSE